MLFFGIGIAVVTVIGIVYYVLNIIGGCKVFVKAGEAGWKALIPFYNGYVELKFTWKTWVFWVIVALSLVSGYLGTIEDPSTLVAIISIIVGIALIVFEWMACDKLAKAFGRGVGFTIGLVFLKPIFTIILGFGPAQYVGNSTLQE